MNLHILQVVTLVSANGAFGGPVAVAVAQTQALAERGHDVTLVAGWDGRALLNIPKVDVRLFRARQAVPGTGVVGLCSPGVWREVRRRAAEADVVHVHLGRDLVSLPAALIADVSGLPLVIQTHGMVRSDHRLKTRVVDGLITRRVLQHSQAQLVLTAEEAVDAPIVAGSAVNTVRIPNGVATPALSAAWDGVEVPEVIFCARLQARKRPVAFVEMAAAFLADGGVARFTMYGPDEGELTAVQNVVRNRGLQGQLTYGGPLSPDHVLPRLSQAQVYVLPSVNEPFPMSLLEAMSLGLPSVITDTTGVSRHLDSSGAAEVTDGSPEAMALALRKLLVSARVWAGHSALARDEIATNFRADAVACQLEGLYDEVMNASQPLIATRPVRWRRPG